MLDRDWLDGLIEKAYKEACPQPVDPFNVTEHAQRTITRRAMRKLADVILADKSSAILAAPVEVLVCPDATLHQNRKQMSGHKFCVECGERL